MRPFRTICLLTEQVNFHVTGVYVTHMVHRFWCFSQLFSHHYHPETPTGETKSHWCVSMRHSENFQIKCRSCPCTRFKDSFDNLHSDRSLVNARQTTTFSTHRRSSRWLTVRVSNGIEIIDNDELCSCEGSIEFLVRSTFFLLLSALNNIRGE